MNCQDFKQFLVRSAEKLHNKQNFEPRPVLKSPNWMIRHVYLNSLIIQLSETTYAAFYPGVSTGYSDSPARAAYNLVQLNTIQLCTPLKFSTLPHETKGLRKPIILNYLPLPPGKSCQSKQPWYSQYWSDQAPPGWHPFRSKAKTRRRPLFHSSHTLHNHNLAQLGIVADSFGSLPKILGTVRRHRSGAQQSTPSAPSSTHLPSSSSTTPNTLAHTIQPETNFENRIIATTTEEESIVEELYL